MSSSGRSRRSQMDSSSVASSDGLGDDNASIDIERDEVKRKSRNLSEKKRRDQFNMLINELCSMVNLDITEDISCSGNKKMDKSSVLRATITFLKNHAEESQNSSRDMGDDSCQTEIASNHSFISSWKPSFLSTEEFSHLSLEALDAFILVFETDLDGRIIYASESILPLLGVSPSHLVTKNYSSLSTSNNEDNFDQHHQHSHPHQQHGTSVYDIIHESEKSALRKLVMESVNCSKPDDYVSMMLHFRYHSSTLNREPPSDECFYELVRIVGTYKRIDDYMGFGSKNCFLSICRLQTPNQLNELHILAPLSSDFGAMKNYEFISRHSLEWKFLFLDHRAPMIIGYLPFEVLGTSGYDYYHWDDLDLVVAGHQRLMQIGSGESCYYRFLTKGQQWIWLRTKYFITYHMWNSKPEFVVCTHTVVGYDERVGHNFRDDSRQITSSDRSKINTETTGSSGTITSSDLIKSSSKSWDPNDFNGRDRSTDMYISDKTSASCSQNNGSNGSISYSSLSSNLLTGGTDGCQSMASSSNSSTDYILSNSIYDPSSFMVNQPPPPSQAQPGMLPSIVEQPPHQQNLQQSQPQNSHHQSHLSQQHSQTQSQQSQHQQQCHQQSSTLTQATTAAAVVTSQQSLQSSQQQSQSQQHLQTHGASGTALTTTTPIASNAIVSLAQYVNVLPPLESPVSSANNLQDFLRKKHILLQKQIKEQQEELKRVSEQLKMVQVVGNVIQTSQSQEKTSELTILQSSPQNQCIPSQLQTNITDTEPMIHRDSGHANLSNLYSNMSCPDNALVPRNYSSTLPTSDITYPSEKRD